MDTQNDQLFLESLSLISQIKLRDYPSESSKFLFSEENYPDDARYVRVFCRKRSVFAHKSKYINERWEIVCYLSPPYYLYYLPSILLACLEQPTSMLSRAVAKSMVPTERGANLSKAYIDYAKEEREAYLAVAQFIKNNFADSRRKTEGNSVPQPS